MKCFRDEQHMNQESVTIPNETRTNLGLSQYELENRLGIGSEYVSNNPTISYILRRAEEHAKICK